MNRRAMHRIYMFIERFKLFEIFAHTKMTISMWNRSDVSNKRQWIENRVFFVQRNLAFHQLSISWCCVQNICFFDHFLWISHFAYKNIFLSLIVFGQPYHRFNKKPMAMVYWIFIDFKSAKSIFFVILVISASEHSPQHSNDNPYLMG